MRESDFRRFLGGAALAALMATGGVMMPKSVAAQTPTDPAVTQTRDLDDNDQDWGWIGLLGLAGLLGLRRRDRHDHMDTTRRT